MASTAPARMRSSRSRLKHTVGPGGPWSKQAPAVVARAYDSPGEAEGWRAWRQHLRGRKRPGLQRIFGSFDSPLAWNLDADGEYEAAFALADWLGELDSLEKNEIAALEKEVDRWLTAADTAVLNAEFGIECLAWCWALPALARYLSESDWWRLFNHLATLPEEAEPASGEAPLLARQLILGELPLALAYLFGELECSKSLLAQARRTLSEGLREVANGRKVPQARYLADLRPLLACWVRARKVSERMDRGWSGAQIDRQLSLVVQAALRLSRSDGRTVFSEDGSLQWEKDLLVNAIRLAGPDAAQMARLALTGRANLRYNKSLPHPSIESEWAALAHLRTNWTPDSPMLTVKYDGPDVELELNTGERALWSGAWGIEVVRAGQRLAPVGGWEQTCWLSDHEIDYFELGLDLEHGVEVERHIVMLRADRVLFMADAVLGQPGLPLEYRGVLPLTDETEFVGERETRDGALTYRGKSVARVLPLALPEWRSGRGPGELETSESGLSLTHATRAGRLFAPLLIDLNPERTRRPLTWRQLTVAEERQNVPHDVAVGFRAEIGDAQWVIYRSLAPPAVRSLLSKSLLNQFLFGVFSDKGKVEPLVEIESAKE